MHYDKKQIYENEVILIQPASSFFFRSESSGIFINHFPAVPPSFVLWQAQKLSVPSGLWENRIEFSGKAWNRGGIFRNFFSQTFDSFLSQQLLEAERQLLSPDGSGNPFSIAFPENETTIRF